MFLLPAMAWQAGLRVTGWGSTHVIHRIACPLLEPSHTRTASLSGEVFSRRFLAPAMRPMSQWRGEPFKVMPCKETMSWLVVIRTWSEGYRRIHGMTHEFSWKTHRRARTSPFNWHFKPRGQLIKNLESQECARFGCAHARAVFTYACA